MNNTKLITLLHRRVISFLKEAIDTIYDMENAAGLSTPESRQTMKELQDIIDDIRTNKFYI